MVQTHWSKYEYFSFNRALFICESLECCKMMERYGLQSLNVHDTDKFERNVLTVKNFVNIFIFDSKNNETLKKISMLIKIFKKNNVFNYKLILNPCWLESKNPIHFYGKALCDNKEMFLRMMTLITTPKRSTKQYSHKNDPTSFIDIKVFIIQYGFEAYFKRDIFRGGKKHIFYFRELYGDKKIECTQIVREIVMMIITKHSLLSLEDFRKIGFSKKPNALLKKLGLTSQCLDSQR